MQKRIDRSVWGCLFRKLGSKIPASCWRRNSWEGVTWQSSNSAPRFRLHEIFSGERGHLREIYRTGIRKVFACTQAATRTAARCSGMVWCSIFGHRADDFARVGSTSVRTSESGSTTAARRGTTRAQAESGTELRCTHRCLTAVEWVLREPFSCCVCVVDLLLLNHRRVSML